MSIPNPSPLLRSQVRNTCSNNKCLIFKECIWRKFLQFRWEKNCPYCNTICNPYRNLMWFQVSTIGINIVMSHYVKLLSFMAIKKRDYQTVYSLDHLHFSAIGENDYTYGWSYQPPSWPSTAHIIKHIFVVR